MSDPHPSSDAALIDVLERSRSLGFLGPGPVTAHVEHARGYLSHVPHGSTVLDLGSGGGVPGLVLAHDRPDAHFVLLDAMEKRSRFLEWAVAELVLQNVRVLCGRAEVLGHEPELRGSFDLVVARSFASPPVLAECAAGFLRVGGRLIVSEPPQDALIDRWPAEPLAQLGLRPERTSSTEHATLQELAQVEVCPERFPRRVGVPSKRPLF